MNLFKFNFCLYVYKIYIIAFVQLILKYTIFFILSPFLTLLINVFLVILGANDNNVFSDLSISIN